MWKEECLKTLQVNYDKGSHYFSHEQYMSDALKVIPIGKLVDFKTLPKQCMPFFEVKEG